MFTHRFVRSCRVSSRLKGKSSCRRALLRSEASSTRVVFPLFLVAAASAATVSVERSPRASIAEDSDGKAGDAEMEVSRSIYYKAEVCSPQPRGHLEDTGSKEAELSSQLAS